MKNKNYDKTDIDSIDILDIIKRGKLLIASSILITLAATFFATIVLIKPVYEASTKILVREEKLNPKDDFPSYETGLQFAHSQAEIMKSKLVLSKALKNIELSEEASNGVDDKSLEMDALQESITLRLIDSTNILELKVEQEHPLLNVIIV